LHKRLDDIYGRFQTFRESTGNVQLNLFIDKIKTLIIPILKDHREIGELAKKSYNTILFVNSLYAQAEDLLLNELGLRDFKVEDDLSYTVNLSDFKSAHRADAEYFQPKYEKIIDKIRPLKFLDLPSLSEIFSIRRGDFISPEYYVEKSKRAYIRIKELSSKGDINLDVVTHIDDNFVDNSLETLSEGDFVFAGIGATLGKTARIPKELYGSFYSNNTARFKVKKNWKDKVDTYYLQVVLQSKICQWQFEQRQAQTAQAKIADEELKTVLIPILPKPFQQKIADLVRQSHEARKKAKELLEKAKKEVEKLVEESE
jgi:type I restriction enzyme, S subunit